MQSTPQQQVFRSSQAWDNFSDRYARKIQKNTSVFCLTLLNMLKYEEANSILDAGCGAGYLHPHMINSKKQNANLYAFDISQEMVHRAAARVKRHLNQQYGSIDLLQCEEVQNINLDDQLFKQVNYHLSIGSVDNLIQYNNEQFDVYVCNLVFQMLPDQSKAIQEAFRVLKPGGKVGITIWGSFDNCTAMWLLKQVAFEIGISKVDMRGGLFLQDNKLPISWAENAGFKNILCWKQMTPFDIFNVEQALSFANPEVEDMLKQMNEEQLKQFKEAIEQKIKKYTENHEPLPFETYILIAEKPL